MLYIEDDPNNIRLVERLLSRRQEVSLLVAATAHDGVQAAIDNRPDLILLDNRLPDASGGEVLRQLASAELIAAIPVVILTADSDGATSKQLLGLGASELLTKPYDIHQFLAMIDRHLS